MQTVKVKDIKVKTGVSTSGKNEGKPWELVIIIGEDGSEFTTFDTAIKEVGIGGTLELEAVIKNNKTNITKFTITQKGSAAPAPGPNGKPDMSKEDWSEKDRLERWSRECNTCFMGITELLTAKIILPDGELANTALDWAMAHFTTTAPAVKKEKPATKKETTADEDFDKLTSASEPIFKNRGEFLTKVTKERGLKTDEICEKLSINDVTEITDYAEAWKTLTQDTDK